MGISLVQIACFDCQALWFDRGEGWQLAPDGVVQLFQLVYEPQSD